MTLYTAEGKPATRRELARALAGKRKLACACGECRTCKQRVYRRKRRAEGKDR